MMGWIKKLSAEIHIGILDSGIIVFIVLVLLTGIYEAWFLSKIQALIQRQTTPETFDVLINSIPIIIGSFATMILPEYIKKAKSEISLGGIEISPFEITLIGVLFLTACSSPYIMYQKSKVALDMALKLNLLRAEQHAIKLDIISYVIGFNILVCILLGILSLYEIEKHNNKIKTVKLGGKDKK